MIREMRSSDIPNCVAISRANFGEKAALRTRAELSRLLRDKLALYYIHIEHDETISGFAGIMPSWLMRDVWDFVWVNVHPEYKGKGVGRLLTEHNINQIKEYGGSAIHLMTQKYAFFKKFEFHAAHVYDGDWVLMVRQLKELKL